MIYFDTSALMKLVVTEDETAPLEAWLDDHPDQPWATSDLTRVELLRGVMRRQPMALLQAQQLITRMVRVPLSDGILLFASTCQPPSDGACALAGAAIATASATPSAHVRRCVLVRAASAAAIMPANPIRIDASAGANPSSGACLHELRQPGAGRPLAKSGP